MTRIECFIIWHHFDENGRVTRASSTACRAQTMHLVQKAIALDNDGKPNIKTEEPYVIPVQVIFLPQEFQCYINWQDENSRRSVEWFGGDMAGLQRFLEQRQLHCPGLIPMQIVQLPILGLSSE